MKLNDTTSLLLSISAMSSPAAVALLQEIEQQKKNGFPEKNLVSIFVPDKYSNHRKRVSEMLMDTSWNALNENIYFIFSGAVKRIMHTRKKQQHNVNFSLLISSVGNNFSLKYTVFQSFQIFLLVIVKHLTNWILGYNLLTGQ